MVNSEPPCGRRHNLLGAGLFSKATAIERVLLTRAEGRENEATEASPCDLSFERPEHTKQENKTQASVRRLGEHAPGRVHMFGQPQRAPPAPPSREDVVRGYRNRFYGQTTPIGEDLCA